MAAPAAATAILVLCDRTILSANMFILTPEILGMASSTKRCIHQLIGVIADINARANQAFVTAGTTGVSSVVTRIVTGRAMAENSWRPSVGGMTDVALFNGR